MSCKLNTCENDENTRLHNSEQNSPTKVNLLADSHTTTSNFFHFRWLRRCSKLKKMFVGFVLVLFTALLGLLALLFIEEAEGIQYRYDVSGDFIVETNECRIPNLSPFTKDAMRVFTREPHRPCSKLKPLVELVQFRENDTKILMIRSEHQNEHLSFWHNKFKCCYKNIYRSEKNETADTEVKISSCRSFNSRHELRKTDEFILVECEGYRETLIGWKPSSTVYKDAYAIIRRKASVSEKLERNRSQRESLPQRKEPLNVFFFGIDSISRLNLIRALPQTYQHVESTGWFEFRGYNKMEDNTFPNLMAILTGRNLSVINNSCNWRQVGELENCEFMWSLYDKAGYVTAYAEDEAKISTFNYFKTGFVKPPTDYYFRPLALAAEDNLEIRDEKNMYICIGRKNYADYIYDYGVDFATTFPNEPKFGFFWTNSFSHEDLSVVSSMDEKVKGYLKQWEVAGILNSSIVFFFSDHGMRFGNIRRYFTGWLEERLPFLYIWLPPAFRQAHPEIVRNLQINRDRLTSPYDVHVTLKHILQMSGGYENGSLTAESCPNCQSLFEEVSKERNCDDAGVDKHWCTCTEYEVTDKTTKEVKNAVNYVLETLNDDLKEFPKCAQLRLHSIHSARKSSRQQDFLISFQVKPSDAELEATVRCEDDECESAKVIGSISRLNRYGDQSACITDSTFRKYCYCMK